MVVLCSFVDLVFCGCWHYFVHDRCHECELLYGLNRYYNGCCRFEGLCMKHFSMTSKNLVHVECEPKLASHSIFSRMQSTVSLDLIFIKHLSLTEPSTNNPPPILPQHSTQKHPRRRPRRRLPQRPHHRNLRPRILRKNHPRPPRPGPNTTIRRNRRLRRRRTRPRSILRLLPRRRH